MGMLTISALGVTAAHRAAGVAGLLACTYHSACAA
jgi:hypothetical protein